jgi:anti-anti-sigma regulatory factor
MKGNTVKLEGDLSIFSAKEIKNKFDTALTEAGDVLINIKKADKLDASLIQLLCSLHNSCLKSNKKMKIEASDNFWDLLDMLGYSRGELLSSKEKK